MLGSKHKMKDSKFMPEEFLELEWHVTPAELAAENARLWRWVVGLSAATVMLAGGLGYALWLFSARYEQ